MAGGFHVGLLRLLNQKLLVALASNPLLIPTPSQRRMAMMNFHVGEIVLSIFIQLFYLIKKRENASPVLKLQFEIIRRQCYIFGINTLSIR